MTVMVVFGATLAIAGAEPHFATIPEENPSAVSTTTMPLGEKSGAKEAGEKIVGTVRIIRSGPLTEVFFMDRKESLVIPRGRDHNAIFEACLLSSQKRSPLNLQIDPKARTILSLSKPSSTSLPTNSSGKANDDSSLGSN